MSNKYEAAPSPEPEEPKILDLTDPRYFPPMPTEPAEEHAKHLDELRALGYDTGDQPEDRDEVVSVDKKKSDK